MPLDEYLLQENIELLNFVPEFRHRKMFGGVGFYSGDFMFALMTKNNLLLLRIDDQTVIKYKDAGAQSFNHDKAKSTMPYWTIPDKIISDQKLLKEWILEAIEVAVRNKKPKKTKKKA